MYYLDSIKQKIANEINNIIGEKSLLISDIVYPPNDEMGDLSLSCFKLSKELKKSPVDTASFLFETLNDLKLKEISSLITLGPYLNFKINKKDLTKNVLNEIKKDRGKYGENKNGAGKKVMVEFSNVNTHKEFHVGHLRNLCFGGAVNNILSANGYKAIPVSYINDFGIHVAKTLWAYQSYFKDKEPLENKGAFLGEIYVESTKRAKEEKNAKQIIEVMMKKIESRRGIEYELWEKTRLWSIEQLDVIYKELDIRFDKIFYESEFIEDGLKKVDELLKKGVLEESQGAVIANLEKYGLGVLIFKRSDGTALYPVADIPLAIEKFKKYKLDKSIYVVDIRQGLHFKQLFKVLELMGYKQEMIHLGYEFLKLPGGMMSSRSGNVITYEELKIKMIEISSRETGERHPEWSSEKINKVAIAIMNGAIKFEMLKVSSAQIITFDINKAMQFSGYTSAYLQYTIARINSIINKSAIKDETLIDFEKLTEEKEIQLVLKMSKYPEVIENAGASYDPSVIAKYLFELAQNFNDYYHSVNIINSEIETKKARILLIKMVSQALGNGLCLLGIETLEEM